MRVTRKLLAALFAAILIVMTFNAYLRVRREAQAFHDDTARDHRFVGRMLRAGLVEVWTLDGPARARAFLDSADKGYGEVRVRLVSLAPDAAPDERPAMPASTLGALARGGDVATESEGRFYTYLPVALPDGVARALELGEPTRVQRQYMRASIVRNTVVTGGVVLACAAVALALGVTLIARPLDRLARKARRIGEGDLGGPLAMAQVDEIGDLAREIDAMCVRLDDARRSVADESAARAALQEQLRHADRLRTVGQLAAGLAHELGTPLNVVLGRANLIRDVPECPEEAREDARIIAEQARRMSALVRTLLGLARRHVSPGEVPDLASLAREALALVSPLAMRAHVTLTLDAEPTRGRVDPIQFQQALTNVVLNAVQATEGPGEVRVRLARERRKGPPGAHHARDSWAVVTVQDRGGGIPPGHLARVFEPFFTTKAAGEGTGLGLAVTQGIVRDHDGWIDVESDPASGTRFTMYFPSPVDDDEGDGAGDGADEVRGPGASEGVR